MLTSFLNEKVRKRFGVELNFLCETLDAGRHWNTMCKELWEKKALILAPLLFWF